MKKLWALPVLAVALCGCGITINGPGAESKPVPAPETVTVEPDPEPTEDSTDNIEPVESDVDSPARTADRRDFLNYISDAAPKLYWEVPDEDLTELGQSVCEALETSPDIDDTQAEMLGLMLKNGLTVNQSVAIFDASVIHVCPEFEGMSSEAMN